MREILCREQLRRSKIIFSGLWLSLVERLVRDQEAVGSNPTSPIFNPTFCSFVHKADQAIAAIRVIANN